MICRRPSVVLLGFALTFTACNVDVNPLPAVRDIGLDGDVSVDGPDLADTDPGDDAADDVRVPDVSEDVAGDADLALGPGDCVELSEWTTGCDGVGVNQDHTLGNGVVEVPIHTATIRLRPVRAGEFVMGSPGGDWDFEAYCAVQDAQVAADHEGCDRACQTPRRVRLTHDYWMMETETRAADWGLIFDQNGPGGLADCDRASCPMRRVNWWQAALWTNRVSCLSGLRPCYLFRGCQGDVPGTEWSCDEVQTVDPALCEGYRLPSEAEWEFAARAGTCSPYSRSDLSCPSAGCGSPEAQAAGNQGWNLCTSVDNETPRPHLVRSVGGAGNGRPNAFGLYDMYGNVAEWTADWLTVTPTTADLVDDPRNCRPDDGSDAYRVARGGSYLDEPRYCRSNWRYAAGPDETERPRRMRPSDRHVAVGLRAVRTMFDGPAPRCTDGTRQCCLASPSCQAASCP